MTKLNIDLYIFSFQDQYIYIHECIKDALVEMGIAAGNSFTKEPNGK